MTASFPQQFSSNCCVETTELLNFILYAVHCPVEPLGMSEECCSHWMTTENFFIFCWPCISSQILANNQLDALFHVFIYLFHLSTCFEHQVLIIRRSNCINTSSGMISLCKWLLGMLVRRELVPGTGIPSSHLRRLIIPDDVLIQFDLLMMSTWCSKHVERLNK